MQGRFVQIRNWANSSRRRLLRRIPVDSRPNTIQYHLCAHGSAWWFRDEWPAVPGLPFRKSWTLQTGVANFVRDELITRLVFTKSRASSRASFLGHEGMSSLVREEHKSVKYSWSKPWSEESWMLIVCSCLVFTICLPQESWIAAESCVLQFLSIWVERNHFKSNELRGRVVVVLHRWK